jgi:hypothetical protein
VGLIGDGGNKRYSFWFILLTFALSACVFYRIDITKGRTEAMKFGCKSHSDEFIPLVERSTVNT